MIWNFLVKCSKSRFLHMLILTGFSSPSTVSFTSSSTKSLSILLNALYQQDVKWVQP